MENLERQNNLLPFLKWAGGKRWFAQTRSNYIPKFFGTYIEPFVGSGAVFFHLKPEKAILGDMNADLIETYQAIKSNWKLVVENLKRLGRNHSERHYYEIRDFRPRTTFSRAARFIYLNRACWNGLYRVNLQGKFNVPIGTKKDIWRETDDFRATSELLEKAILRSGDFEDTIKMAKTGDFLFVDPPYTVKHNNNGFIKYNEKMFSWKDQIRLRNCLVLAKSRGVKILVTNAFHKPLRRLYAGYFSTKRLDRSSVIAADPERRGKTEELLIIG